MEITFYQTTSENLQVTKTLINPLTMTGNLKDSTDIRRPKILVTGNNSALVPFNYCYIPEFSRYYFVTNWSYVRNNVMTADFTCDVLMSFNVRGLNAIIDGSENMGSNYLPSNVFKTNVKDVTDILSFGGGLSTNGEFILITAGG